MSDDRSFEPRWASPPGESIQAMCARKNISGEVVKVKLRLNDDDFSALLSGHRRITRSVAEGLSSLLGRPTDFWLTRDSVYLHDLSRLRNEISHWLTLLPVADMGRMGWIEKSTALERKAQECFEFFGVKTVEEWEERWSKDVGATHFRTSPTYSSNAPAVASWLRFGELRAAETECPPFSLSRLRDSIPRLRQLTRIHDPHRFLPEVTEICRSVGVVVCIAKTPTGCRASGATRFLGSRKALMMLSFRYLSDDHFWFTFFHEVGHLLLHPDQEFLEGDAEFDSPAEREANDFAQTLLIPKEFEKQLGSVAKNYRDVIRFAKDVGVSPGIIVGQLQHRGILSRDRMNFLKRRFSWQP